MQSDSELKTHASKTSEFQADKFWYLLVDLQSRGLAGLEPAPSTTASMPQESSRGVVLKYFYRPRCSEPSEEPIGVGSFPCAVVIDSVAPLRF